MAHLTLVPKNRHLADFDVSSGTSSPEVPQLRIVPTGSIDYSSETSSAPRYSAETIVGLPALIKDISDIYSDCQKDNWDGEGANAISLAAYMHTLQLLAHLPAELPLPSVNPDVDGFIELEWYAKGKSFSLLIGARPVLFWAGYYSREKRRNGREPFDEKFPEDLISEVKMVYV